MSMQVCTLNEHAGMYMNEHAGMYMTEHAGKCMYEHAGMYMNEHPGLYMHDRAGMCMHERAGMYTCASMLPSRQQCRWICGRPRRLFERWAEVGYADSLSGRLRRVGMLT